MFIMNIVVLGSLTFMCYDQTQIEEFIKGKSKFFLYNYLNT